MTQKEYLDYCYRHDKSYRKMVDDGERRWKRFKICLALILPVSIIGIALFGIADVFIAMIIGSAIITFLKKLG